MCPKASARHRMLLRSRQRRGPGILSLRHHTATYPSGVASLTKEVVSLINGGGFFAVLFALRRWRTRRNLWLNFGAGSNQLRRWEHRSSRGRRVYAFSNDKWHQRLHLLLVNRILLRKMPKQKPFLLLEFDPKGGRHQRQSQPATQLA
jgi:hypothetical protein